MINGADAQAEANEIHVAAMGYVQRMEEQEVEIPTIYLRTERVAWAPTVHQMRRLMRDAYTAGRYAEKQARKSR